MVPCFPPHASQEVPQHPLRETPPLLPHQERRLQPPIRQKQTRPDPTRPVAGAVVFRRAAPSTRARCPCPSPGSRGQTHRHPLHSTSLTQVALALVPEPAAASSAAARTGGSPRRLSPRPTLPQRRPTNLPIFFDVATVSNQHKHQHQHQHQHQRQQQQRHRQRRSNVPVADTRLLSRCPPLPLPSLSPPHVALYPLTCLPPASPSCPIPGDGQRQQQSPGKRIRALSPRGRRNHQPARRPLPAGPSQEPLPSLSPEAPSLARRARGGPRGDTRLTAPRPTHRCAYIDQHT